MEALRETKSIKLTGYLSVPARRVRPAREEKRYTPSSHLTMKQSGGCQLSYPGVTSIFQRSYFATIGADGVKCDFREPERAAGPRDVRSTNSFLDVCAFAKILAEQSVSLAINRNI
jgi:hypothetical protein